MFFGHTCVCRSSVHGGQQKEEEEGKHAEGQEEDIQEKFCPILASQHV